MFLEEDVVTVDVHIETFPMIEGKVSGKQVKAVIADSSDNNNKHLFKKDFTLLGS